MGLHLRTRRQRRTWWIYRRQTCTLASGTLADVGGCWWMLAKARPSARRAMAGSTPMRTAAGADIDAHACSKRVAPHGNCRIFRPGCRNFLQTRICQYLKTLRP